MLIFALLIGPANIYLLTRKRRRIWLLWTVPVFSLLTCAAVAGFMFLSEGLDPHVRVEGITILDETAERATSIGWLGVYAPLTPTDGLHFMQATESQGTEVTPHLNSSYGIIRQGAGRAVDWTNDEALGAGWLTARVPAHFQMRTTEQRLERLLLAKGNDGTFSVENALKANIGTLWVADEAGKVYMAAALPTAGRTALTLTTKKTGSSEDKLRKGFAGDWLAFVKSVAANPEEYLRPRCYIAVLEASPFLEQGLRNVGTRTGRSVVYGIMKAP